MHLSEGYPSVKTQFSKKTCSVQHTQLSTTINTVFIETTCEYLELFRRGELLRVLLEPVGHNHASVKSWQCKEGLNSQRRGEHLLGFLALINRLAILLQNLPNSTQNTKWD